MNRQKRRDYNEKFYERLRKRHPDRIAEYDRKLAERIAAARVPALELPPGALGDLAEPAGPAMPGFDPRDLALETIVSDERPVLFVKDGALLGSEVTIIGPEARDLVDRIMAAADRIHPLLPLIGRIDVVSFGNAEYLGTGWFVREDIVVTNRHVARLIAQREGRRFVFSRGVGGKPIEASVCNAHEYDDPSPEAARVFKVKDVLYIEPDSGAYDIALLKVDRPVGGSGPPYIPLADADVADDTPVCVIGYPARAGRDRIPDQELMKKLYLDRYDVKRAAPGYSTGVLGGSSTHDCTTLGGNSGSVLLDLASGKAVGLHYAGLYKENNFAVPATIVRDYVEGRRPTLPVAIEPAGSATGVNAAGADPNASNPDAAALGLPASITVDFGAGNGGGGLGRATYVFSRPGVELVDRALKAFWKERPADVIAARVGFEDDGVRIGEAPFIAASVPAARLAAVEAAAPKQYRGVPVRYLPATLDEILESTPLIESVDTIRYDDDARTGPEFAFDAVDEVMDVTLHVGPEYSWQVLESFLKSVQGDVVSAMYEFTAKHIQEAIEDRLDVPGVTWSFVLDNATFAKIRNEELEFDRVETFRRWADEHGVKRIVVPEGTAGLISDAYHIKVTVSGDTFWLSSGNWKPESSQPVITDAQRNAATTDDLPGNREWHVVITNPTLAGRFRNHLRRDLATSADLGGRELPRRLLDDERVIDIPIEESMVLERAAPTKLLEPKSITGRRLTVKPLLTPDRQGAVYSEAVLDLINGARDSLLFQIPYIGMPGNPNEDRGFIDELIGALVDRLTSLDDARVLLRSGGSRFSSPAHAAWYFKSKGVDIDERLRVIEDHHTKGMIVDGRRVLLGSHNWSKPGVSLNRDASLLFDDAEVAAYFTEAFEIDWARARPVTPRKFVRTEAVLEAVGDAPPTGYRRVRLSEWLSDDD